MKCQICFSDILPIKVAEEPFIAGTSDIWSLGMSIYELLTGHILWEGMGGCVQLNGARIPALDNGYSPQLDQFLHACLSLNTWDRPTAQQAYNYANSMLKQEVNHPAMRLFILERRILFCKRDGAGGSGGVEVCTADGECRWFTSCFSIELA